MSHFRPRSRRLLGVGACALVATAPVLDARPPDVGAAVQDSVCTVEVDVPAGPLQGVVEYVEREATLRYEIEEAVLQEDTLRVEVRESVTDREVVPAVMESESRMIELLPARTDWVRDAPDSELPLSLGDLHDLKTAGVALETVEVGTCLHEHFDPAEPELAPVELLVREPVDVYTVEPPVFRTESTAVEYEPAYRRLIEVPTAFENVTRREPVVFRATGVEAPVQYESVTVQAVEQEAMVTTVEVPAKTISVDVRRKLSDAKVKQTREPGVTESVELVQSIGRGEFLWLDDKAARRNLSLARRDRTTRRATGRVACLRAFPAVHHSYQREVVKEPARIVSTEHDAEYRSVDIKRLERDARAVEHPVAPVMAQRTVQSKPVAARVETHAVPCEDAMTKADVRALQIALEERGFRPGPADGIMGRGTRRAIWRFQRAHGLETRAGLTTATLAMLGVSATPHDAD